MIKIEIASDASIPTDEKHRLEAAVRAILADAQLCQGNISLAIVDDPTIRVLNQRYLEHDYATDTLSFTLEHNEHALGGALLEGEVIVSHETAARVAPEFGWTAAEELLLYVIHGTLHLVGHDDQTIEGAESMRRQEAAYLKQVGVSPSGVTSRKMTDAMRENSRDKTSSSTASQGAALK